MSTIQVNPRIERRAMLRAQARINPCLVADIRENVHNLGVCRRRIERMLSGELVIKTSASKRKLRGQLRDLDAEISDLRTDLKLLNADV